MSKKRKAIIIGVNDYRDVNIRDLRFAISDANRLSGMLEHLPGESCYDVSFLANPTASEVMDSLDTVMMSLSPQDDFFFYFAGHGLQPLGSSQHLLLCSDAHRGILQGHGTNGAIPHTYLNDVVKHCCAEMFFCFDACRTAVQPDRSLMPEMTGSSALRDIGVAQQQAHRGTCMTLLSCSDGESAEENIELGGGIFTFALIDYMKTCLASNRSIIFNADLVRNISTQMKQHRTSGTQTPVITSSGGKEFVLFAGKTSIPVDSSVFSSPSLNLELEEERNRLEREKRLAAEHAEHAERLRLEECQGWQGSKGGDRKLLTINGVKYAFRWCPPGTFMMGSSTNEGTRRGDEIQHQVTLSHGFWMSETQVTQGMWQRVMGDNPSHFTGENKLPVESVSWEDCQMFIDQLNSMTGSVLNGFKFSLPTEAQWEYACRAGTTTSFNSRKNLTNDLYSPLDQGGWYALNSSSKTHPVGMKQANEWGLYDMHGNVSEWCESWYGAYSTGSVTNPSGPSGVGAALASGDKSLELLVPFCHQWPLWLKRLAWVVCWWYFDFDKNSNIDKRTVLLTPQRIHRGGSWLSSAAECRSAHRGSDLPSQRTNNLGLRLALVRF